jgi:hypothetical protein
MKKRAAILLFIAALGLPLAAGAQSRETSRSARPTQISQVVSRWAHALLQRISAIFPTPLSGGSPDGHCTIDPNGGGCTSG